VKARLLVSVVVSLDLAASIRANSPDVLPKGQLLGWSSRKAIRLS
jgi:hypothetical protein